MMSNPSLCLYASKARCARAGPQVRGGFMHSMAELRPGLTREQRGQAEAARQQLVLDLEQQVS